MLAPGFDFKDFGKCLLVSLFGELGDKSFFLVVVLIVWCPWQGIRDGKRANAERMLVCLGALVALGVRAILLSALPDPRYWTCWFDAATCVLTGLMALRAAFVLRRLPGDDAPADPAGAPPQEEGTPATVWNQAAFLGSMQPALGASSSADEPPSTDAPKWNRSAFPAFLEAAPYGTFAPPARSADGLLSDRIDDGLASQILALPITLALVFVAEADDKSETAMIESRLRGPDAVIGTIIGIMIAFAVAFLVGYVLERQLSKRQVLLAILLTTSALCLATVGQAFLHLNWLSPLAAEAAAPAAAVQQQTLLNLTLPSNGTFA